MGVDVDGSGSLTYHELVEGVEQKEDLPLIYSIMDCDQSGTISCDEFVDQLHKMKSQDTQLLLIFIKYHVQTVIRDAKEEMGLLKDLMQKMQEASGDGLFQSRNVQDSVPKSPVEGFEIGMKSQLSQLHAVLDNLRANAIQDLDAITRATEQHMIGVDIVARSALAPGANPDHTLNCYSAALSKAQTTADELDTNAVSVGDRVAVHAGSLSGSAAKFGKDWTKTL